MPSVKKFQAEYQADTNQVGGNFCQQLAAFDNPVKMFKLFCTHKIYVTCCKTSLPWAVKTFNVYRFCFIKEIYSLQHLFATCNCLICCKAGLIVGGKTRSIVIQFILQQCHKTTCTFLLPILL